MWKARGGRDGVARAQERRGVSRVAVALGRRKSCRRRPILHKRDTYTQTNYRQIIANLRAEKDKAAVSGSTVDWVASGFDKHFSFVLVQLSQLVHNPLKSKNTRILLSLFSLPSHPSAASYDPRAIVWQPDARQTAQTSSRWLFTTLRSPTTTSPHRALPWPHSSPR